MPISALGYLGIRSPKMEEWSQFASGLLGMQKIDTAAKQLTFRMDDWSQRFIVADEPGETISFIGWEVSQKEDLDIYAARLEANGLAVERGTKALSNQRFVSDLIVFRDPAGNRVELVWNPIKTEDPFVPGRPIQGFKTGPYGMGHVVFHVDNVEAMLAFYRDILGFGISDYGLTPYPLYFFHVNGRHHSMAMVGSGKRGLHHFMIEFQNLDDVGQGYDLAQLEAGRVSFTLGRHTNDYMTSFYTTTPSSFFVENGWGGRVIDPKTWTPHETFEGPSFWGHERLYLKEEEGRRALRDMRLKAAREGLRSPPMPDCPWLFDQIGK